MRLIGDILVLLFCVLGSSFFCLHEVFFWLKGYVASLSFLIVIIIITVSNEIVSNKIDILLFFFVFIKFPTDKKIVTLRERDCK